MHYVYCSRVYCDVNITKWENFTKLSSLVRNVNEKLTHGITRYLKDDSFGLTTCCRLLYLFCDEIIVAF